MLYDSPLKWPSAAEPAHVHATLQRLETLLNLVDHLVAGPLKMWEMHANYIYKWTDEDVRTYAYRATCEPCFMGFVRTVNAGAGMLCARGPSIDWSDNENVFKPLWDNIDAAGMKGTVFASKLAALVLTHGLSLILVDHTAPPKGVEMTRANEKEYNLRPVWRMYKRRNVVNWQSERINNMTVLTRVTLREEYDEADGPYGTKQRERFRVLIVEDGKARWELHAGTLADAKTGTRTYEMIDSGDFRNADGAARSSLPIAVAALGGEEVAHTMNAVVPLQGVAFANLAHWRAATSLTFNREVCGFEQLVVTGDLQRAAGDPITESPRLKIGPLVAIQVERGGSVSYVAPNGNGLAQLQKSCEEKMEEMDKQGLGFLVPQVSGSPTATEVRVKAHAQYSTLADAGVAVADALNYAWEITGWYAGVDKAEVPSLSLATDFADTSMGSDVMSAYSTLVENGFPKRVVLRVMQDGGRIPENEDLDELQAEWDGALEALRMVRDEEARARLQERGPDALNTTDDSDGQTDDDQSDKSASEIPSETAGDDDANGDV